MPWRGEVAVLGAIQTGLLVLVVAVELGVVLVGLGLYLGHGAWSTRSGPRTAQRRAQGRAALQAALDDEQGGPVDPGQLAELRRRVQIDVLAGVAPSLAGGQRQRLTALATELRLVAHAEARCRSRLWWRRLRGARLCTLLGGGTATVPPLLADRRPEVRAQAAEWAVEHHDDEMIGLLLQMLDADDGSTRFTVKDSLIRIGRPLTERLACHLSMAGQGVPATPAGPALEVALALPDPVLLPAALALCHDDSPRVRALAASLAGAIGGAPAIEVLIGLLGDEAPETRASAARALGRSGHWPAAPALAGLLGDPSWDVRRQASVALRVLGSPGMLFLRRALSAPDPFAANAARHVLDLPDSALRTL